MARPANWITDKDRLLLGAKEVANGCWEWMNKSDDCGYGVIRAFGKSWKAHRLSYHLFIGLPNNGDLHVCHRCDNPKCINPTHLFLGTRSDNQRDSVAKRRHTNSKKELCCNGHPFNDSNTYRQGTRRRCKTCDRLRKHTPEGRRRKREWMRQYRAKVKAGWSTARPA